MTEEDARWHQLEAVRDEIDRAAVVVPICISRIDGKPHELSPKARRFAEALSFTEALGERTYGPRANGKAQRGVDPGAVRPRLAGETSLPSGRGLIA